MSISGHKIYAPKGIGVLYIKKRTRLERIISGGGQEKGLRSGTLPVPLCVALGKAAEMCEELRESECKRMEELSSYLKNFIMSNLEDVTFNGHPDFRVPHNLHFSFSCVEGESLMMRIKDIAVSSGSACTSGSLEPSYVLKAVGLREDLIHTGVRIVLGRYTTIEEVKIIGEKMVEAVNKLRSFSPLWDMKLKGIDLGSVKWAEHH
jgi:cysteine desulfurase